MKRLPLLFLLSVAVLGPRTAEAQRAYFNGTTQSNMTACPVTGNIVYVLQTYTGYYADPNEPYPNTGDLGYVHAVGSNVAPCVNDAVGFEFFLPDGASLAISGNNPVYCMRGHVNDSFWEYVPNDANGACAQAPSTGPNGGYFFGWSALPPAWWLEVRVPVVYNKQLLGLAGPTSHRLTVAASSAYGTLFPYQPVTVFYRAAFQNLASSGITPSSATVAFTLQNYYKGGLLYVDYGPTTAFGTSLPAVSIGSTFASVAINAQLTGLNPSTLYYWRARFVTTDGTFATLSQTFTTAAASPQSLTVSKTGTGAGTVTSNPAGVDCGATCTANFAYGTNVTLSAVAAAGSSFSGWSGSGCSGTAQCVVTANAAKTVTAAFARQMGSLSLTLGGLPAGSSATLGITGPDGFSTTRTLTTGTGVNLSDVPTGTYTVTAPATTVGGTTYVPNAPSQAAVVNFGATATVNVTYSQARRIGDFDGDGNTDILWESSSGYVAAWLMNGITETQNLLLYNIPVAVDGWHIAGAGDFNGDGKTDILWQSDSGYVAAWIMNGTTQTTNQLLYSYPVAVGGWHIAAAGDLNGDGISDILWQDNAGYVAYWLMAVNSSGVVVQQSNGLLDTRPVAAGGWKIVATGDLNGDRKTDIVWQSPDGFVAAWLMNGLSQVSNTLLYQVAVATDGWTIVGAGDMNHDGMVDLLWQQRPLSATDTTRGYLATWFMNGINHAGTSLLSPSRITDPAWKIVGPK